MLYLSTEKGREVGLKQTTGSAETLTMAIGQQQLIKDRVFPVGSAWVWKDDYVIAGGPDPEARYWSPVENRIFLYAPGTNICAGFSTFVGAVEQIMQGTLRPVVDPNLSGMSRAEQEYYRKG